MGVIQYLLSYKDKLFVSFRCDFPAFPSVLILSCSLLSPPGCPHSYTFTSITWHSIVFLFFFGPTKSFEKLLSSCDCLVVFGSLPTLKQYCDDKRYLPFLPFFLWTFKQNRYKSIYLKTLWNTLWFECAKAKKLPKDHRRKALLRAPRE